MGGETISLWISRKVTNRKNNKLSLQMTEFFGPTHGGVWEEPDSEQD